MSILSHESTTTTTLTTTQKIIVGAAGMGVSLANVTEILQFIGAATGAFIGLWMCAEKLILVYKKFNSKNESQD